ncbi:IS701 family transposase, partial [Frankia sp. Cr1]|uniref:IS701 family transposase n=1 Tax=Frankia sp. Cr1 TaxID=3073931 RepID=UPI002AD29721
LFEPDGVLVLDETGFIKKGNRSAGVQRQYSGTAGRIENCQVGVFAVYASGRGRAYVDRELYLPEKWTDDRERCREAGIPDDVAFATKTELALVMVRRFHEAHPQLGWVAGDEVYGRSPELRTWLEDHEIGYVLAVATNTVVSTAQGRFRVDALATMVPDTAWETYSCADGSKGPRLYDWALVETADAAGPAGRPRQVLVRRSRGEKKELAFYLTHSSRPVPLAALVTVAGRRWNVEECFQSGKNEVALDHYQVRLYRAWYRHITLSMFAHAWLAVTVAKNREKNRPPKERVATATGYVREPDGSIPIADPPVPARNKMIPFTLNEIRHIIVQVWQKAIPFSVTRRWSDWRRRHQERASYYHFLRRIRAARASATPVAAT